MIWVDQDDNELARLPREVVHDKQKLLLHRETMELLFADKEHTQFWMQKRAESKEQYLGKWTMSVTCHVNGEDITPDDPLGYMGAGMREGLEELGVTVVKQELVAKQIITTPENEAIAGIITAEYEGIPKANLEEVSEIRLFTKETIGEIKDQLTPAALICLILLGIIQDEEKAK